MAKSSKITAIIIAKNEENNLPECLQSLNWTDEILLVDDYSEDSTKSIATKFGARVVGATEKQKGNYSELRNLGLLESRTDWVIYVDADERITSGLKAELVRLLRKKSKRYSAYAIPRLNIILGKEMKHGGWWPDYVKRIYKRDKLKKWIGDLHEEPQFEGEMGHLKMPIEHQKHDNLSDMVQKTNRWSTVEARLMEDSGHPNMNFFRFSSAIFREFWLRVIIQKGYLDGTEGIIYSLYQTFSKFISYSKLWEMQIVKNKRALSVKSLP